MKDLHSFAEHTDEASEIPADVQTRINGIVDGTGDVPTTTGGLYWNQVKDSELKLIKDGFGIAY